MAVGSSSSGIMRASSSFPAVGQMEPVAHGPLLSVNNIIQLLLHIGE